MVSKVKTEKDPHRIFNLRVKPMFTMDSKDADPKLLSSS